MRRATPIAMPRRRPATPIATRRPDPATPIATRRRGPTNPFDRLRWPSTPLGIAALSMQLVAVALLAGCASIGLDRKPAWEQPPPPVQHTPVVQPDALTRTSLANGIEVLILEDHRLPQVSLAVTVRRGAGAEPVGQAGLAELTAELMNRGAGDRDALALAEAVDDIGARLSVRSDWDAMEVSVSGLSRDLDTLFAILRDVALSPRFESDEADKARAELLASLEADRDDPATVAGKVAMRTLYPGHRYGQPRSGAPETVADLDATDARALHQRYFVASNMIVSASGDVTPAEALDRIRRDFGDLARGEPPAPTPAPPSPTPTERRIVIADDPSLVQARILIVHDGLARTDERRIAAGVMNATLGGSGFSSRLMQRLRSEEGLTYGVGSYFDLRSEPGPFVVSTFTRVPETRRAVDLLLAQLEAMQASAPPTAAELADAKSYMTGQFGLGLETSAAVIGALVDLSVHGLPDDALDTYRTRVDEVTLDDDAAIARETLHPERAAIVLLGPAEALVPQMSGLGQPQVVDP